MDYPNELTFFRAAAINAKTVAATKLGTTENGTQTFYPLWLTVYLASATLATIIGVASVGTNATNYNNVMTAVTMTGLTTVGKLIMSSLTAVGSSVAANTDIYFNLTTGFTATAATIDVELWGYYR